MEKDTAIHDVRQRCYKSIKIVLGFIPEDNENFGVHPKYVEIVKQIAEEFGEDYMTEESVGSCLDLDYYFNTFGTFLDWVENYYNKL
jgi:hypothetical protein